MNNAIQDAILEFGSQNRLAKAVGVSQAAVRKWREGGGMDVRHAQKIEELTGGKVTAKQISDGINPNQGAGNGSNENRKTESP
ncbi:TPA: transcriptional regulator [Neisseria meningitidis]